MWLGDSDSGRLKAGAGRTAVLAVIALLLWRLAEPVAGVESRTYDLVQKLTAGPAPASVVVVSTDEVAANPWQFPGLAALVSVIHQTQPRVIAVASPAPTLIQRQDLTRLRTLIDLENRAGMDPDDRRIAGLTRQLRDAEAWLADSADTAAAMVTAGNVVLGLAPLARQPGAELANDPCGARLVEVSAAYADLGKDTRPPRALAPAPAGLCLAAAAIGHLDWPVEADGVIRRGGLMLTSSDIGVPSVAMAAALLAGSAPPGRMVEGTFTRHYAGPGGSSGFTVIPAAELLAGGRRNELTNSLVVIGDTGNPSMATPVSISAGPAIVLASDLANLVAGDRIARPAWLAGFEIGVAIALAAAAAFVLFPLAFQPAAIGGLIAAGFLMMAELLVLAIFGFWIHLAGLAVFCIAVAAILPVFRLLPESVTGTAHTGARSGLAAPGPRAGEELDLAFSVLRQQPTTDQTKRRLYDLAMEHGRHRDYARAERVFRYLSARDPDYRDVAAKLEKLSGARVNSQGRTLVRPAASPEPAPSGMSRALGRYELERVIGRGAMATVYLGRDPTINRRVAIKTLPLAEEFAESDLASARANFIREAESSGRLNHPNIIAIHDAGEDNRIAYLAMEYFEGRPLSYYAQVGHLLSPRKVCELMARAAETLHYAHTQNVVHRDVKPANLLYDEATDTLKLTDFGIARLTDTSRTRTGIILGTPSYMSPEQLRASKVSGRSDLYSLGVTMYHLLTGSPPFQADSIARLMDKIVHQPHRPVRDVRDDVPTCADEILDRALAKDPDDRFADGQAMALALRDCCSRFASELI